MFNIKLYLEKFKGLGQGEKILKENISVAVAECVGVRLEIQNISIKNSEVTLKTSPAIKSAVFIKQDKILSKVREKTSQNITVIR